jgi:hypothetical protein
MNSTVARHLISQKFQVRKNEIITLKPLKGHISNTQEASLMKMMKL